MLPDSSVLTSQAAANPNIGEEIITLVKKGYTPVQAMEQVVKRDPHPEYRQIALLTSTGGMSIHSGSQTRPFSGFSKGQDCIAIGNFLKSEQVLVAMTEEFNGLHDGASLSDRLIAALYAGKNSGGQQGSDGKHLDERSACLMVHTPGEQFPVNSRVDYSSDAITELKKAINAYQPMHKFYLARATNPVELPPQDQWSENLDMSSS
jgi:uncharacterized Ntn-hydrolase superfamily protein